jgi:hypothetical protein
MTKPLNYLADKFHEIDPLDSGPNPALERAAASRAKRMRWKLP